MKVFLKISKYSRENFIKNRLQHKCFPANIENFLRTSILEEIYE